MDYLARALARELGWEPNRGTEWEKTACVFSVNTVCTKAGICGERNECADVLVDE